MPSLVSMEELTPSPYFTTVQAAAGTQENPIEIQDSEIRVQLNKTI